MGKKVFISHSSKDSVYAINFVELLKNFGFQDKDIFCSSDYSTGVNYGERIFKRLKSELLDGPIMIYLLSKNYYESVICLNEMGASWMMSEDHYPITLPKFDVKDIEGAISQDRLSLVAGDRFQVNDLFRLIREVSSSADIKWPEPVELSAIEYVKPIQERLNEVFSESESLCPVEDEWFETVLGERRDVLGKYKDKASCFELPKTILPKHLNVNDEETERRQFLFIWNNQGEFESGERVRFHLKDSTQKQFPDIGLCRNIYVNFINKLDE
ncbi:TIR domain-containing protein [Enterococcus malodoratus]|uniref:TIR domain-containing protein n=1 Tax=Enterococcus malodoratus TaxID=71451 RepID=UPI0020749775|nr:TIR domain-containing protein [Enterococcus malodoratus]